MDCARFDPLFSNDCVLQREKPIRLWGRCRPGASLRIRLLDPSDASGASRILAEQTLSAREETFFVTLPAQAAGGPYTLALSEDDRISQTITNVMIGEVWLAGGQSNMEYELQNDADAVCPERHLDLSALRGVSVRFYQVLRQAYFEDSFLPEQLRNHWMTPSDPGFGTWSAVAFHFASELSLSLGCCVGIIGCNWGGTSAAAWQDRESLLSHPETAVYVTEYEELIAGQTPEEYERARADYFAYQKEWQPKIDAFYAAHPDGSWDDALAFAGPCQWPGPMGPKHEFRPCGLYETMLRRVAPCSLRGFLYYQGESDEHRPDAYEVLLRSLLQVWRRDFQDETLYFMNVQLPMHRYANEAVSDSWARIREAQRKVHETDPLSGLAVAIDLGEFNNIHPTHKKEIGHRLFLQTMAHVYQKLASCKAYGPMLRAASYQQASHSLLLAFDYADSGFDRSRYDSVLNSPHDTPQTALLGFEAAGADGRFYRVSAEFQDGDQSITLRLPDHCPPPAFVRYLWTNYSQVPLFDRNGFPAAPFLKQLI